MGATSMSAGNEFTAGSVRHCRVPISNIASNAIVYTEPSNLSLARSHFHVVEIHPSTYRKRSTSSMCKIISQTFELAKRSIHNSATKSRRVTEVVSCVAKSRSRQVRWHDSVFAFHTLQLRIRDRSTRVRVTAID